MLIMVGVYGRTSKIKNVVGRSDYISNTSRQEEIVFHKSKMLHTWKEHHDFEQAHRKSKEANNEALEVHLALPNELSADCSKLEEICDDLVSALVGKNKDYEYAVHWNQKRTNLHVHILFSERENQVDLIEKRYKKDIWHDKDTHRLAKAGAENAILVHKKGDIQKDKDGNIKYQTDIFKEKDKRYIKRNWANELKIAIKEVMTHHEYEMTVTNDESPFLTQKKLYKGASEDYLKHALEWNNAVKDYNRALAEYISSDVRDDSIEELINQKKEIIKETNKINAAMHKITKSAIDFVKDLAKSIMNLIEYRTKDSKRDVLCYYHDLEQKENVIAYDRDCFYMNGLRLDKHLEYDDILDHVVNTIDYGAEYEMSDDFAQAYEEYLEEEGIEI